MKPGYFETHRLPTRLVISFSILIMLISLFAFIGWLSASRWMTALWPGGIPMAPSTALLFLLFGLALLFRIKPVGSEHFNWLSPSLAWSGTILAILLLILSNLGIHLKVEYLGMRISGMVRGVPIGHMSPLTAFCFIIVGLSLLLQYHNGKRLLLSFWLAAALFMISLTLIIGYLVGAPILYGTGIIPPAMTTSLAFLMTGLALLFITGLQIWPYDPLHDDTSSQATTILFLVFLLMATTLLSIGYLYSKNLQRHFEQQADAQLATIVNLKANTLKQWRRERLQDGSIFFKNEAFSGLIADYFHDPGNYQAKRQIQTWLARFQHHSEYDLILLLDPHGVQRLSLPNENKDETNPQEEDFSQIIHAHRITFLGFHRDSHEKKVHMDLAVPILSGQHWQNTLGLLILRIDLQSVLFPLIKQMPIASNTAESFLVRRKGQDVLFLNNLRFKNDTALSLSFPLTKADSPAAMAILGKPGTVHGIDYRGVPVLAAIRSVPGTPWYLVTKMDLKEINEPLYERLFWIAGLLGALLLGSGAVVGLIWRNQRVGLYRVKYLAARAAEDSEKRLLTIFENAKDGIMVADSENKRFVFANRAMSDMLGYQHEELLSLSVKDIHPVERLEQIHAQFEQQARGESSITSDTPMKCKDGSIFYADINTTPIEFGDRLCLLGTFRDVTERMQAEARINHLNRVLRAIRDINQLIVKAKSADKLIRNACEMLTVRGSYINALIVLIDRDTHIIDYAIAGTGSADRLVREIEEGEIPQCCKVADTIVGICLIGGHSDTCNECAMADSCISPQKMSIRLRHQDRMFGYLTVSLDQEIVMDTEEERLVVELADDLAYSLHNIEMNAAVRTAEQEREKIEAQLFQAQKMEAVGQLAGGVAHDFNNLLTVILGYSQMMLEEAKADSAYAEPAGEIHEAAVRAKNLTRQLLAFSRKQMLEMRIIDTNQVVTDFEKLLRRTIGENIHMEVLLIKEPTWIKADVSQIEQILMNLAVNARDAMPNGGNLTIETAFADLDESYVASKLGATPGRHVMLSISDTGEGMDHETLAKIFEPFYTTKALGHGTGLGLSTVYGVVKQHGGNIWVYSEPGQGTTFKIYLPTAVEEETKTEDEEKSSPSIPERSGTVFILVVEDESSLRRLACNILRKAGYAVLEAQDAENAIEIAAKSSKPIDLLLTDVVMPKMTGVDLLKKLGESHPETKVLYMSGYTENVIARQGILKEGVNFLQKPFSAKSLLEKVGKIFKN